MPLSRPAIITIAIFDFMWGWHDYINPLVFRWDPDQFTLSVGLRLYFSQRGAEWGLLTAAATMFTLPMVLVFFFAQRTFIEGISFTGVKGQAIPETAGRSRTPVPDCSRAAASLESGYTGI